MPKWTKRLGTITEVRLILLVSLFVGIFLNRAFFSGVFEIYPPSWEHLPFLISLLLVLVFLMALLLVIVSNRFTVKPILIFTLLASTVTGYFMDTYNVVIDQTMLVNTWETNAGEATDLLSLQLFLYVGLLGILPSWFIWKVKIRRTNWRKSLLHKSGLAGFCVLAMAALMFSQSRAFASFFREHKPLRYYTNPIYSFYSAAKFIGDGSGKEETVIEPIGLDAVRSPLAKGRRLIIFVVGESARADHFSLNGYERETNPLLAQRDVFSFKHFSSSGTSTAVAVPRMFSRYTREEGSMKTVKSHENVLDVLQRAGVRVLWRDNNSSSKGVAARVEYQDFKLPENNPVFDEEGRDEGMLVGLQDYINQSPEGDILIVLHQMGCHGPAYYKRYPEAFEKFAPVCKTNQLDECSEDEILNAYDNILVYTDFVLAKTIDLLEENQEQFKTALFYVSDHGESLGEKGLYLHGLPYAVAPDGQVHVPAILWFGNDFPVDREALEEIEEEPLSHDTIFHTLLGLFEVETRLYEPELDLLQISCMKEDENSDL